MRSDGRDPAIAAGALEAIEKVRAIDSDGRIPLLSITGEFISRSVHVHITEQNFNVKVLEPGFAEPFNGIPFIVNEECHLSVRHGPTNREWFRVG